MISLAVFDVSTVGIAEVGQKPARPPAPMRASVDASRTSDENKRHWANADAFSADAATDPATRFKLRNRARYEFTNNCYAKGVVRSAADDMIGTGPRLQLTIPGDDDGEVAREIEASWQHWADLTHFAIKLRTAHKSYERDGECFGLFDTNERLKHPIQFDTRWLEADQCTTPFEKVYDPFTADGVKFDRLGNPIEYYFLQTHPGATAIIGLTPLKYFTVLADRVVHWKPQDRFGQHRAIPELTPALPLYSQLRRYTLATLTAAEFAAMLAGVMKTAIPPEGGSSPVSVDNWALFELVRGALLTIPQGWDAEQFKPEQPTTTYPDFKRELLNETGRATGQPLNVVTGNSSGYNYSSGRLDHVPYHRSTRIKRNDLRLIVLDPIFRDGWYPEALMVGVISRDLPAIEKWRWAWNWDGFDSIDPNKDAMTDDLRLSNGTSTHAEIFAEYNQDWREAFQQLAKEKAYAQKLGLPWPMGAITAVSGTKREAPMPAKAVMSAMVDEGVSEDVAVEAMRQLFGRNGHANGAHK